MKQSELSKFMIMQILIEPVKSNEIQLLTDVSRKSFYDTFFEHNAKEDMDLFLEKNLDVESLQIEFSNPLNSFFFARADNEIAGYLKLSTCRTADTLNSDQAIEIARLYAVKEKIGLGIGKALMEFSVSLTNKLNRKIIWLGVWEHNQRAINFYRRCGFKKFGEHIFALGNDLQTDWLMKKELEF